MTKEKEYRDYSSYYREKQRELSKKRRKPRIVIGAIMIAGTATGILLYGRGRYLNGIHEGSRESIRRTLNLFREIWPDMEIDTKLISWAEKNPERFLQIMDKGL